MDKDSVEVAFAGEKSRTSPVFESSREKVLLDAVPVFRPIASDLDDLQVHRSVSRKLSSEGITHDDLSMIAQTTTDPRRRETAKYLSRHFDDISDLSSGENRNIDSADLSLYKNLLVQRSLRPDEVNVGGWERLHYESEMRKPTEASSNGQLIGTMAGVAGYVAAFQLLPLKFTPLTFVASVIGVAVCSTTGNLIGQAIEGRREKIALHFVDEAAPAMCRLMLDQK